MAPSSQTLRDITDRAEQDLNIYAAKTSARETSSADSKFPDAGYGNRVPPEEGGEVDARGR